MGHNKYKQALITSGSLTQDSGFGAFTLGYEFTCKVPIRVVALGYWFAPHGCSICKKEYDHKVGLWEELPIGPAPALASKLITPGSHESKDNFRFKLLKKSIELVPDISYMVGGVGGIEDNDIFGSNPEKLNISDEINYVGARFLFGTKLQKPTSGSPGVVGWFGGNFVYEVI